jgi:hypothetical protein
MSTKNYNQTSNNGPFDPQRDLGGWGISDILRDIAISWQLMWDRQVSLTLKLCLPIFAVFYWIWPVDLLVGMPFDDIAVIVLATRLFVQMAPPDAVERALIRMGRLQPRTPSDQPDREVWDIWDDEIDENTINGKWRVVDDKKTL